MAEWLSPISGRKNHLFTQDAKFPRFYNSACGRFVNGELLAPAMPGDSKCARCVRAEKRDALIAPMPQVHR